MAFKSTSFVIFGCLLAVSFIISTEAAVPKCPGHEDGTPTYYPDPDDCQYFYECSNGKAYHIKCGKGTYWDTTVDACNTADDVSCGSRSTPAPVTEASF
ncbi:uncharacterized protein LOC115880410 [Sitophilus oryzae]|uniref:Uncharacterized protein LOC115880410 n=1 Tax=Sitophilus oryzae TaxID=7048 RepID=A0A6J2XS57_SITOR|nr:uncharacterized protein LOC115880410 [Sitophilus oryzae]